ncbi:MAG: hypothetical protein CFE33_05925 [Pseudorhodobacter sp. PARRP1]|nr:MAG: hypothetical protein CFE33_05925 [Pseudorhodobacter sp. PARRP1]
MILVRLGFSQACNQCSRTAIAIFLAKRRGAAGFSRIYVDKMRTSQFMLRNKYCGFYFCAC